jgi:Raf kinase inhibitor-like YbhB/YbcL family protein
VETVSEQKEKQIIPTASAVLDDGTIVELVFQPQGRGTFLAIHNAGRWTLLDKFDLGPDARLVPFSPGNNLIIHWVVYNMPPNTKSLPENAGKAGLPPGALLGLNDFKKAGYGGPCPPIGRHRYFHKLYALDITLDSRDATKSQIERAMQGHVLANAELIGTYQKGDR